MVLAAIPARHGATRFPGKPLALIAGRPMIAWVIEAALKARSIDDVAVVTDHEAIATAAREAGARALTSPREAASGSDRIAHLLAADRSAGEARVVVNLQVDEPLLEPAAIDAAVDALTARASIDVATLVRGFRDDEDPADPDLVKVARAADGRGIYFSRSPIPWHRPTWVHVGLYAYRRSAFDRFVATPPTELECVERLEQLRAIEAGLTIHCEPFDSLSIGVDRQQDVARVEAVLTEAGLDTRVDGR